MSNAIEIKNLSFSYKNYDKIGFEYCDSIFANLNLSIAKGDHVLIAGSPNSGKTTLSRILTKAIDKYIKGKLEGEISISGKELKNIQPWDLMNLLSIIEQNTSEQLISTTVIDEMAFPLESLGINRKEIKLRISSSLKEWDLEDKKDFNPQILSGGEKKRLLLAICYSINPEIIIFDETFDELDENWKDYLKDKIKNSKKTIIVLQSRVNESLKGVFNKIFKIEGKKLLEIDETELFNGNKTYKKFSINSSTALITAENVSVEHRPNFCLQIPFFKLNKGEVVSLIGRNGSGKTTFARALCGLDNLSMGNFSYSKQDLPLKVGYLFQNPDYQIFLPTVMDELSYPPSNKTTKEEIEKTCKRFDLDPKKNASLISYPERKRLQAAVYYQLDRDFYILDEIESSLDNETSYSLINALREKGAGILLITHEKEIMNWCNRTYFIENQILKEAINEI
ncbi:MAG: ABC transporter ATP-binding protein [Sphaerochaetaceae bacterium]